MSAFFIKHPAIAAVIAIVTTLLGLVCMFNLPISQYPEITPRTIQLQAMFPGPARRRWRIPWALPWNARFPACRAWTT